MIDSDGGISPAETGDVGVGASLFITSTGDWHVSYVNGTTEALQYILVPGGTKQPGAPEVVTVLHYGDSPTTADSITADVRRLFQARFGDAGHGFLLIAKPWAWYGHNGVRLEGRGWKIEPASQSRAPDGIHGLGEDRGAEALVVGDLVRDREDADGGGEGERGF